MHPGALPGHFGGALGLRRRIGEAARSRGVADDRVRNPERVELRAEGQVRFTAVPGDEMVSDD
jgi:hypothetical protein